MGITIGIDLGGTKMAAGRVDEDGALLSFTSVPRPRRAEDMAEAPLALAEEHFDDQVEAIGLGVAGLVTSDGVLVWGPNVVGQNIAYRDLLVDRFDRPVCVDNDANLAALAEARVGAARGYDHSLTLTLGTGIGGGIILDGKIFRGASFAGEIGHVIVDVGGPECTCGHRGCWETFASGRRLDQMARDEAARHPDGRVAALSESGTPVGAHLTAAALQGDAAARRLLAEMAGWLGLGIANLIAILDLEIVVIGGAASEAGDMLLAPTRRAMRSHLAGAEQRPEVPIVGAALGAHAGLVGAALAAKELLDA